MGWIDEFAGFVKAHRIVALLLAGIIFFVIIIMILIKRIKSYDRGMQESVSKPLSSVYGQNILSEGDLLKRKEVIEKARAVVKDAKNRGYSEMEIKNNFRIKGWKDTDIAEVFK